MKEATTPLKMKLEKWVFFPPLAGILLFCFWVYRDPQRAGDQLQGIFRFVTHELAGFFQVYVLIIFGLALYMIFSRMGQNRFGHDKPDFSTATWLGMLFTCQAGLGVLTWTTIEFFYYLQSPAWGIEPFSKEAQAWASVFPLFHWGFSIFALSAVFGVVFGLVFGHQKAPFMDHPADLPSADVGLGFLDPPLELLPAEFAPGRHHLKSGQPDLMRPVRDHRVVDDLFRGLVCLLLGYGRFHVFRQGGVYIGVPAKAFRLLNILPASSFRSPSNAGNMLAKCLSQLSGIICFFD